ncbi:MAG: precorrin-6y C5,15-methyltransferase (decarboxylating) subunit CbiE [Methanobacterium sp.]|nr:precorrin-6y C5,15-methyltransferase (decarboxylating) subunit CbiE [Methanobacterium sp.]
MSKLYVIGIGPGSKEYLTFKAQKIVDSSDMLVGSKRALALFPENKVKKLEVNAQNMEKMFKESISYVSSGKTVALLSTGDPGFSGVLKPILNLKDDIDIEVIPGISSVQLCAAKLQIPWDDADLVTLHGKGVSNDLLDLLENGKPTVILPNFDLNEIARFLLDHDVDPQREVVICEKLSYPDERIVKMSLGDVLKDDFSYMCVMVIF